MECKIEGVYMNPRYKILNIGQDTYILDIGGSSLWRIIFPLFYWILPVNVYKVNDEKLINKVLAPYVKKKRVGWQGFFGGIVALGLGNLIYPSIEYLNISITPLTSITILLVIFLLIIGLFYYSNILCGRKLRQHIHLEKHRKEKLWIRPNSKGYCIDILVFYFLMVTFTVFSIGASLQTPNGFLFVGYTVFLFISLAIGIITIKVGDTTVRFKDK